MSKEQISQAVTTAQAMIYRATQVPVDRKIDAAVRESLEVLRVSLSDESLAPDLLGHLDYFCTLVRASGVLDIPFKAARHREVEVEAKKLLRILNSKEPDSN